MKVQNYCYNREVIPQVGPSRRVYKKNSDEISFNGGMPKLKTAGINLNKKLYVLGLKVPMLKKYWKVSEDAAKSLGITSPLELDAFRHIWSSADVTYRYNKFFAKLLGGLNEYRNPFCSIPDTNADLWNNRVGRKIGIKIKKMKLPKDEINTFTKNALENGDAIIDPNKDLRQYKSPVFSAFKKFVKFLHD